MNKSAMKAKACSFMSLYISSWPISIPAILMLYIQHLYQIQIRELRLIVCINEQYSSFPAMVIQLIDGVFELDILGGFLVSGMSFGLMRILMRLFFWDFDDYNDIARQWTMFSINLLALAFTGYSLYKTAKFHGKILFELLPLSINTVATLILLLIKLFQKGYQFDLVGYVIEIFTYFLFCYTFSLLHARLLMKQKLPIKKFCNFLLLALAIGSIVIMVLVVSSVIGRSCDNNLIQASLAGFLTELVSFIPTFYFGWDILRNLTKKHRAQKEQLKQNNDSQIFFESINDRYIKERKKQIQLVLIAYTISLVLRGLVLIFNFSWESYITCVQCQGVSIISSDQFLGQFMLVLIEINQLIPHLIIPIALFIIPVKNMRRSSEVDFNSTLIEVEEEEQDQSDVLQRRITQKIKSRSSISPTKSQISQ